MSMPIKQTRGKRWRRNHIKNTTLEQRHTEVHWPKTAHCDLKRHTEKAQGRNIKHKKLKNDDGIGQQVQEINCEGKAAEKHRECQKDFAKANSKKICKSLRKSARAKMRVDRKKV